jgi:hypothetical protein
VSLRPSDVVVPGEAALQLWGVLQGGKFSGGARLQAPDFPATLSWLRPLAPPLLGAVPLATMPTATLSATVQASAETVGLGTLTGTVAGVPVSGDLALRLGPRPALAANLRLSGPLLDGWMPPLPDTLAQGAQAPAAWSRWAATCDADLTVDAERPVWRGTVFDDLSLQARAANGTVTLAAAKLAGPGIAASLSGRLDPGGRIGDGAVTIDLADAGRMAATLPPSLRFAAPLLRGPGKLEAALSGGAEALAVTAEAELSDASAQVDGRLDVAHAHWRGSVALRHPGAPRLLTAVGLPAVGAWAGDGSLSLQAGADAAPGHVRLSGLDVSAGALHVSGDLSWSRPGAGVPRLDGALAFDTLPVPLPYLRSTNPFPLRALQAMDATVALRTGHLEWGRTGEGDPASAQVTVHDGTLRLDKVAAHLAGGDLSGTAQIVAADPPLLSLDATLSGAQIDAPVFGTGLDLVRGGVDGAVHLRAAGYSPAAVLSSLAGSVQATVHDGVISGLDAGRFMARLGGPAPGDDAAIRQAGAELSRALEGGQTPFSVLQASGGFAAGLLTLQSASLETQGAGLAGSGLVDLPADSLDLSLQLRPAIAGAPAARLRVIGPAATPAHSADLGAILQWLATRPPAPDTASK